LKKLVFIFASLMICGVSQASTISCAGDYLGYHFDVRANAVKSKLKGAVSVLITSVSTNQKSILTPTSSDISAHKYLRFSGQGPDGMGSLSADYDSNSGQYRGTLDARTSMGSAQVPVLCALSGRSLFSETQLDEEIVD
jgi:hypothetical protein